MSFPHRHHDEYMLSAERRIIFKDIEKPAENPAENKTKTWLDYLKHSLDLVPSPILPIKPSIAINTAEKLAGLKEKTAEQLKKEEEKAADHLSADAIEVASKPPLHPDANAQDVDAVQSAPTTFEKAVDWCQKQYSSMDKQSFKNFAWKATLSLGGISLLYLIGKKIFGKKEGSRIPSWIAIPGFGLLALYLFPYLKKAGGSIMSGLAHLHPATKAAADAASAAQKLADAIVGKPGDKDKSLLDQAKDLAGAAQKPVEGAGIAFGDAKNRFMETFGKQSAEMAEALKNSESTEGLIANFLLHGGQIVILGGGAYFIRGATNTVLYIPSLLGAAGNALYQQDMESGAGFVKIYLEGAVAYATTFGVFDFLRARKQLVGRMELNAAQRALWHVAGKSMQWPVEVVKKGVVTAGYIMQAPKTGKLILVKAEALVRTPARTLHGLRHTVDSGVLGLRPVNLEVGESGIETLFNEWHEWRALRQRTEQLGGDVSSLTRRMKAIEEELATGLSVFQQKNGRVPAFIQDIQQQNLLTQIQSDAAAGKRGKSIPMENLRDALIKSAPMQGNKVSPAAAITTAAGAPGDAAKAANVSAPPVSTEFEVFDEATGRFMSEEAARDLAEMRAIDSAVTAEIVDEVFPAQIVDEATPSPRSTPRVDASPSSAARTTSSSVDVVPPARTSIPPLVPSARPMPGAPPLVAASGRSFDIPPTDGTGALKPDLVPHAPVPVPPPPALKIFHGDDVVESAEVADDFVRQSEWESAIVKYGKNVGIEDVTEFLTVAQREGALMLDTETLALIKESPGAKKIIVGAIEAGKEAGDLTEVSRALRAARMARNLRVGLNALGGAGDAFSVVMAYADFVENGERIEIAKQTKNAELAAIYSRANYVYAAEGMQGVVGLIIGGVAITKAYVGGQSLLTAAGAAGGLIMIPVAVAAVSGGYVYRKAEGVTETWLRNAKDWERELPPGQLLEKLKELAPGQQSYWQGWGKGTTSEQLVRKIFTSRESFAEWEQKGFETVEGANTKVRYEITKAFIVRTAQLAKLPKESDQEFQRRFDQHIIDQMEYITFMTQGTYAYAMGPMYEQARLYADLKAKSRILTTQNRSEILEWQTEEGEKHSFDLKEFQNLPILADRGGDDALHIVARSRDRQVEQKVLQFSLLTQLRDTGLSESAKRQIVCRELLNDMGDDLLKLDGRIAVANFEGVWRGESRGTALARYTVSRILRDALQTQADQLLAKAASKNITREDYENALLKIGAAIGQQDVLAYQRMGTEKGYARASDFSVEGAQNMLDPAMILQSLGA